MRKIDGYKVPSKYTRDFLQKLFVMFQHHGNLYKAFFNNYKTNYHLSTFSSTFTSKENGAPSSYTHSPKIFCTTHICLTSWTIHYIFAWPWRQVVQLARKFHHFAQNLLDNRFLCSLWLLWKDFSLQIIQKCKKTLCKFKSMAIYSTQISNFIPFPPLYDIFMMLYFESCLW